MIELPEQEYDAVREALAKKQEEEDAAALANDQREKATGLSVNEELPVAGSPARPALEDFRTEGGKTKRRRRKGHIPLTHQQREANSRLTPRHRASAEEANWAK